MREQVFTLAAVAAAVAVGGACWLLTATMSAAFYTSPAIAQEWNNASFGMLLLMWAAMMAAMMLPAATPFLRLFWRCCVCQKIAPQTHTAAAAGGYFLLWGGFSAAAAALHATAAELHALNDTMAVTHPLARAFFFAAAGIYQFTPLKFSCLRGCRPPPLFLLLHWRRGLDGAFLVGLKNGLYCVGCCWALMLLLFVGGVMDLRWIVGLTLYALLEKIVPPTPLLSRLVGGGLLGLAVWELI